MLQAEQSPDKGDLSDDGAGCQSDQQIQDDGNQDQQQVHVEKPLEQGEEDDLIEAVKEHDLQGIVACQLQKGKILGEFSANFQQNHHKGKCQNKFGKIIVGALIPYQQPGGNCHQYQAARKDHILFPVIEGGEFQTVLPEEHADEEKYKKAYGAAQLEIGEGFKIGKIIAPVYQDQTDDGHRNSYFFEEGGSLVFGSPVQYGEAIDQQDRIREPIQTAADECTENLRADGRAVGEFTGNE